jgi:hypothetical protein
MACKASSIFILTMNAKGFTMTNSLCLELNPVAAGTSNPISLNLQRQALVNVPDAGDVRIACAEGAVWITLDNDTRDIVIEAGETFSTPEHRRAVIYALKPSRVNVTALASMASPALKTRRLFPRALFAPSPNPALAASATWY